MPLLTPVPQGLTSAPSVLQYDRRPGKVVLSCGPVVRPRHVETRHQIGAGCACPLARECPAYGTGPTDPTVAAALVKGPRAAEIVAMAQAG